MSPHLKLITWFEKNARDLPWRRERTPYRVWISEMMLQQTQVKTVIPYYVNWMKNYPNLSSLYKAKMEKVLKSWQGLGYYQRAFKIKEAATIVEEKFNRKFPNNYQDLITLPGIGDYTAKAILNFAFKKNYLAIDGNVFKVFSRLALIPYHPNNQLSKPMIEQAFQKINPKKEKLALFNEALFELGALICLKKNPLCPLCPIKKNCLSKRESKTDCYPVKTKKQLEPVNSTSLVVIDSRKLLLRFREKENRLNNMWEFPTLEHHSFSPNDLPLIKQFFLKKYEIKVEIKSFLGSFTHFYTKYKIHHHSHLATIVGEKKPLKKNKTAFFSLSEIEQLSLSKSNQKILAILKKSNPFLKKN